MGVSESRYAEFASGASIPAPMDLLNLAEQSNISADYLFGLLALYPSTLHHPSIFRPRDRRNEYRPDQIEFLRAVEHWERFVSPMSERESDKMILSILKLLDNIAQADRRAAPGRADEIVALVEQVLGIALDASIRATLAQTLTAKMVSWHSPAERNAPEGAK
jgi:hypothetical protein